MKVNHKILSIPPYLSVSWDRISALYQRNGRLMIQLVEGESIEIPHLTEEQMKEIFQAHAEVTESLSQAPTEPLSPFNFLSNMKEAQEEGPFKISFGIADGMGNFMQHNPQQSDGPELPPEVLEKIVTLAAALVPDELKELPPPEPNCRCMHCQIVGHLHDFAPFEQEEEAVEEVSEEELRFEQWVVNPLTGNLFQVTNKLDPKEEYRVSLHPVGCTCGEEGCEHVVAALQS